MLSNKQYIRHQLIILAFSLFFSFKANAQKVRVIDNKGTIKIANKNRFFSSTADPKTSKTVEGDIWHNDDEKVTKIWYVYQDNGEEKGRWEDLINKANLFPPIDSIASNTLTLNEGHHTIITKPFSGDDDKVIIIKFPKPSEHLGKIYRIRNTTNDPVPLECSGCETDPFINNGGEPITEIGYGKTYVFQSDGVKWQQINGNN